MNRKIALSLALVLGLSLISSTQPASAVVAIIPHRGHLILEGIGDPETVDPAWAYDSPSAELIANVYDTLIQFDREKTDEFVPALAVNWWIEDISESDPDTGITWLRRITFEIRGTSGSHNWEWIGEEWPDGYYHETSPWTSEKWYEGYGFRLGQGRWKDNNKNGQRDTGDYLEMLRFKWGVFPEWRWFRVTSGSNSPITVEEMPVKFHNNAIMTTEDVEYSFERWMVQDRSGGPAWMIYEPVEDIGYYHAFYYTSDPEIQGLIIDHAFQRNDTHVWMNLAVRYAPMLGILAQHWASILCKSFTTAVPGEWDGNYPVDWSENGPHDPSESPLDTAGNKMCGTGPYSMGFDFGDGKGYWTHGVEWSIVRFPQYWQGWPYKYASDYNYRVTEKVVYEWETRRDDFRAGTADTVYVPRRHIMDIYHEPGIRGLPDLPPGISLPPGEFWGLPMLSADAMFFTEAIDPASPYVGSGKLDGNGVPLTFFEDLHIRKAFAYMFDADTYIQWVWQGEAVQPSSPVIAGIPYHINVPTYQYSLTKAAAEFQTASADPTSPAYQVWDKGFYFKMTYNTGNLPRRILTDMIKLAAYLINSKFRIDIVGLTWSTYLGEIWWYPSGKSILPIFMIDKFADYPDPHYWLLPFMHTYGEFSYPTSYHNPTVDAKIKEGIGKEGDAARKPIYEQLQMLYYEDVPSVMLAQPLGRRWERDWVQGWYYNPLLAVSTESVSGPYFYHMWEGLNGDVNNDKTVNALDGGKVSSWTYLPPFYGPNTELYGYNVKYDIGPYLQYQIDKFPPPGDSVGTIDSVDRQVINAHFSEEEV